MEFEGRKRIGIQLNIAPLIDVVFLLLTFFMLSSHFVNRPGIELTLPGALTARLHPQEDIIITISADGSLYLDEEEIALDGLLGRLRTKIEVVGKKTIIIRADKRIDLGLAVKIMDIARRAEAEKLIISTELEEDVKR